MEDKDKSEVLENELVKPENFVVIQKKKSNINKKKSISKKVERFSPTVKNGLTQEQVNTRVAEKLVNVTEDKNTKTYRQIFFNNIFTFFNMLCFLVAGALITVGAFKNTVYMVVVLANLAIGIIQEVRAKITVEKIKLVTSPTVMIVREGLKIEILASEMVLDDVVFFETGKQISVDAIILEGDVEVNESLLTGESVPVRKRKGDFLFSGSFIVGGRCYAKVEKVGNESYSAKLANKAKEYKKPKSELLASLRMIIKIIGVIIIPMSILMYYHNLSMTGNNMVETINNTAGPIIGMIPAGMFLLTSMALAVGVIKLAKRRTLVQDIYGIEMLARANVLCLDKTGTITDGTMKVNSVVLLESNSSVKVDDIMGSMLTALDDNNQTSQALVSHFGYSKAYTPKEILPFTSGRKLSAVTFKSGETFAMGAPEFILKVKDKVVDAQVRNFAQKGFRVLLLAKCEGQIVNDKLPAKREAVALIVIEDHIREDAHETIAWFKENGVEIKIISGDNPITVSEVSRRVGVENAERYINLEGLSEQQVVDAVGNYTVFGRVSPEQKLYIIKALKNKGNKVAMTGDGVNDILALKEADCSIAMASGSEATRHVSHLVLLDSNFSSMPNVVAEGRRVVNNIQNSASLFLMKTIFTLLLCLFVFAVDIRYPFEPIQVTLLEFCVIGIPSFFLALQPNSSRIKGKFLPNLFARAFPAAIIIFLNVVACYALYDMGIITELDYITMGALSVTFTGMLVVLRLCKPLNIYRGIMFTADLLILVALLTFVPFGVFEYVQLSLQNILFIIVFVQISYPVYSNLVRFFDNYIR